LTDPLKPADDSRIGSESPERGTRAPKRRYAHPALTEYGPVGKLTRSGSDTIGDPNSMMMACL